MAFVKEPDTAPVEELCETFRRLAQAQAVEPQDIDDVVQEAVKAVLENQAGPSRFAKTRTRTARGSFTKRSWIITGSKNAAGAR